MSNTTTDKKTTSEVNLAEEITSLFEGAEVTDELRGKISTVFEAVVSSKVLEHKEQLEEEYQNKLAEAITAERVEIDENVNTYLDYVITEWLEENKIAIESGIRTEMTDSFISGIRNVFEQHNIELPEGTEDALSIAENKNEKLEYKLNESIETIAGLKKTVENFHREQIIDFQGKGLADTQKEKLAKLVEGIEFVSEDAFTNKVKTIRESFFKDDKSDNQDLNEHTKNPIGNDNTNRMNRYIQAMAR